MDHTVKLEVRSRTSVGAAWPVRARRDVWLLILALLAWGTAAFAVGHQEERVWDEEGAEEFRDTTVPVATSPSLCSQFQAGSFRTGTFRDYAGATRSFSVAVGGSDPFKGGESDCLGRCGGGCKYKVTLIDGDQNPYTQACLNHDLCVGWHRFYLDVPLHHVCQEQGFWNQAKTDYDNSPDCYGNLVPFKPANWPRPVIMSSSIGTLVDRSSFSVSEKIYVDAAFKNLGPHRIPNRFSVRLRVSNAFGEVWKTTWTKLGLLNGNYTYRSDLTLPSLPIGAYTLKLYVDLGDAVAESLEGDNVLTRSFDVTAGAGANGLCYLDEACSVGNLYRARDSGSNQCVAASSCTELWKCAAGPVTRTCGGGSTCCTFSPGCAGDVQTCSPGFCTSLGSCQDLIVH